MTTANQTSSIHHVNASSVRRYRDTRLAALSTGPDVFGSTFAYERGRDEAFWTSRIASA